MPLKQPGELLRSSDSKAGCTPLCRRRTSVSLRSSSLCSQQSLCHRSAYKAVCRPPLRRPWWKRRACVSPLAHPVALAIPIARPWVAELGIILRCNELTWAGRKCVDLIYALASDLIGVELGDGCGALVAQVQLGRQFKISLHF